MIQPLLLLGTSTYNSPALNVIYLYQNLIFPLVDTAIDMNV